jgi:signal transduction histidine kinase
MRPFVWITLLQPYTWPRRQRLALILGALLLHALLFVLLYPSIGGIVGALAAIPAMLAGILLGRKGGGLTGLAAFPLNQGLFTVVEGRSLFTLDASLFGILMVCLMGFATGWLSELLQQLRQQAQALRLERAALQAEIARRRAAEAEMFQTKQAAEAAKRTAEAANQAKSVFLANMNHELRTPLNAIIGYTELLQEDLPDLTRSEIIRDLGRIRQASIHLLGLINDVLDLAKIEAGRTELLLETFALAPLLENVAATIQPMVEQHRNTLRVSLDDPQIIMHADQMKVRQVLLNLLSNATKFTFAGTISLTVTCESPRPDALPTTSPWIIFRISDTGIGMSAEQLGRLFTAFTQVHNEVSGKYGGTGLGLVISQSLCHMMDGNITVESTSGQGTTFSVYLPAAVGPPLPTESAPLTNPAPTPRSSPSPLTPHSVAPHSPSPPPASACSNSR